MPDGRRVIPLWEIEEESPMAPDGTEGRRYRYRWSCQILYGDYADFMDLQQRKQEIARSHGWSPATFWTATAGGLNDFFLECEYDELVLLVRELEEREADYEFMRLMRESYKHVVQGSVRIEFYETASSVA